MMEKVKDFYGAHPIRRVLLTLVLLVAVILLVYYAPSFSLKAAEVPQVAPAVTAKGDEIPVDGTVTVAQRGGHSLTLDTKELVLTLKDDETGILWQSTVKNAAEGKDKALMFVDYLGDDNNILTWNTYDNCVKFGTYKLYAIANGVRMELNVNEGDSNEFFEYLPQRMTVETYDRFIAYLDTALAEGKLTENEIAKYRQVFTDLYKAQKGKNAAGETIDFYALTMAGKPPISAAKQLIALAGLVEYSRDDLINDCAVFGTEPTFHEPAQFDIVLEATLDENGDMLVRVPSTELKSGNPFYQVQRLSVLPNLGANSCEEKLDGYFLVPDGAGALLRFNTFTATVPDYTRPFMDNDYYTDYYYMPEYGEDLMTPVFGILNGGDEPQNGLMAIIENGMETANMHVTLAAAKSKGINKAYVSCDVLEYAKVKIYGAYSDNGATYVSTSGNIPLDFTLRYRPYAKPVTYFDLAMDYRQYLSEQTGKAIATPEGPSTYLEVLGAVTLTDRFLGIPYDNVTSMTTYKQLAEMLGELPQNAGVAVQYDGAFNGGIISELNNGAKLVKENGSKEDLKAAYDAAGQQGINLFMQVNLSRVYKNGRNYLPSQHALRDFGNEAATVYPYRGDTGRFNGTWDPIRPYTMVSPKYLPTLAQSFMDGLSELGLPVNVAVGDLAHDVFVDYRYRNIIDPIAARTLAKDSLTTLSARTLSLEEPTTDLAPMGQYAVNVSRASSDYTSIYATVPFRQLVLSGLTQVVSPTVNLTSAPLSHYLLEAAELGTSVKFTVSYSSGDVLKNSHFEHLYAVSWNDWKDEVLDAAAKCAELRKELGGKAILNHRMLDTEVFETTYEGGVRVLTNYSSQPYESTDGTVAPNAYLIVKEGGAL